MAFLCKWWEFWGRGLFPSWAWSSSFEAPGPAGAHSSAKDGLGLLGSGSDALLCEAAKL